MKKLSLILAGAILFVACKDGDSSKKAETSEAKAVANATTGTPYAIDSTSVINWTGSKPTGSHTGTFKITEGALNIADGKLAGGTFTIDINSLNNVDMASDPKQKEKLEGHLKSPDFFDVAKYPTAKFEITAVEPFVAGSDSNMKVLEGATNIIKGNLTLKDVTKNISFPAKVTADATTAAASADFDIDRTLWGMNYKGPNNPQDWFISKTVNIKLSVAATKK